MQLESERHQNIEERIYRDPTPEEEKENSKTKIKPGDIRSHQTNELNNFCRVVDYYVLEQGMCLEYAFISAKQKMYTLYGVKLRWKKK